MTDLDVLNRYATIRTRADKALKPLLFNLPSMSPSSDLSWEFPDSPRLSAESYGYSLMNLYAGSESTITLWVEVRFGINDEETVFLDFSEKYFSAWMEANS